MNTSLPLVPGLRLAAAAQASPAWPARLPPGRQARSAAAHEHAGTQAPAGRPARPAAAGTALALDLAALARHTRRADHLAWQALRGAALAQAQAERAQARRQAGGRLWAWLTGG